MLERQRDAVILRLLQRQEFVTIGELRELTGASEATVRRDLSRLELHGLVQRLRGGARPSAQGRPGERARRPLEAPAEEPLAERIGIKAERKRLIGRRAARLCVADQTVIIDGGSTTYYLAEELSAVDLTVITNSFALARVLFDHGTTRLIVPGGEIDPESQLIFDGFDRGFYEDYTADLLFLGTEGIDEEGLTNTQARLVHDERRMMQRAKRVIVLADSEKFGRHGHIRLCGLGEIDTVVTDEGLPGTFRDLLAERGIETILAP
jgi:DeoR family ulaG and ulaABCDEF operon transcriptional repressor